MILQILFYKLQDHVDEAQLVEMIRTSRSILLKIPEILSVRSGRSIQPDADWPFFVALEYDSLDKKRIAEDDPVYLKFHKIIIEPLTAASYIMDYETDPSKDLKYS